MENLLNTIRSYDLRIYLELYNFGLNHSFIESCYYFFAKYGILIFFLSFIYLIWRTRINALICSMLAVAIAGSIDLIIYILWQRPRPFIAHANIVAPDTSKFTVDMSSFPSSHTYIAFAIATSVFLYGHKKLGIILFVIAILVAISRIGAGLHYPSDVIGGTMLGIFSGILAYLATHKLEKYWE